MHVFIIKLNVYVFYAIGKGSFNIEGISRFYYKYIPKLLPQIIACLLENFFCNITCKLNIA